MMEFFDSIWSWIVNNYKGIMGVLTSGTALGTIGAIVLAVRNSILTKNNSVIVNSTKSAISDSNAIKNAVMDMTKTVSDFKDILVQLQEKLSTMNDSTSINEEDLKTKIDAILEVQRIVYSTVKDDNVRNMVTSILNNAKNAESLSRAELLEELKTLRKYISDKSEDMAKIASNSSVTEATSSVTKANSSVTKAESEENLTVKKEEGQESVTLVRY